MNYSDYYLWLYSIVSDGNHDTLIRYLYETLFRWQFTLDANRSEGGLNLRKNFAFESGVSIQEVGSGPCSVLEMIIALADRMTEFIDLDIRDCFWIMINNLGLSQFYDGRFDASKVNYILNVWLNREYDRFGNGSLFPLKEYRGDCKTLDIWGQMNAWLEENYPYSNKWLYD